ncbi:uncharacterized protein DNG_02824 [Cephalotrichum gorgonifer]|uniref:Uncharacterized protein n=1 Tax=Cephalotrichum gorgonifer TaxID=2041049 RepID=A0AAE8MV39_9PEZI|nr:uncharacterized protein DNG_02824 [Cephalotrichum gorgonifer]
MSGIRAKFSGVRRSLRRDKYASLEGGDDDGECGDDCRCEEEDKEWDELVAGMRRAYQLLHGLVPVLKGMERKINLLTEIVVNMEKLQVSNMGPPTDDEEDSEAEKALDGGQTTNAGLTPSRRRASKGVSKEHGGQATSS